MSPLQPAVAMVGVTASVWSLLFIRRISFLKRNNIEVQQTNTPRKRDSVYQQYDDSEYAQLPAYNLANLFEMPVLFYALCIMAHQLQMTSHHIVPLAWVYVALRTVHSLIHCTYNQVMHRFIAYFLSCLVLWVMAVLVALKVFSL